MDPVDKQKLRKNLCFLQEYLPELESIADYLYQEDVIERDNVQRIRHEPTDSGKVRILVHVLMLKQNGYKELKHFLSGDEDYKYIIDKLESTEIDHEEIRRVEQSNEEFIIEFLQRTFIEEEGKNVLRALMEEDLRREYLMNEKSYDMPDWHVVDEIVKRTFPTSERKKAGHKKKKEWQYKGLRRQHLVDDDDDSESKDDDMSRESNDGTPDTQRSSESEVKITQMNASTLRILLSVKFRENDLDQSYLDVFEKQKITGKVFLKTDVDDLDRMFKDEMPYGDKKSIIILRDEIKEAEENGTLKVPSLPEKLNVSEKTVEGNDVATSIEERYFRERFRNFGKNATSSTVYRQNAVLKTTVLVPQNLIDPVHRFIGRGNEHSLDSIIDRTLRFAAACLNTRRNGTIHIGVRSTEENDDSDLRGLVEGISVTKGKFISEFYKKIQVLFSKDQLTLICSCIRSPQFIEVSSPDEANTHKRFIIEIDVVPQSGLIEEETFFTSEAGGSSDASLYVFALEKAFPFKLESKDIPDFMITRSRINKQRHEQETTSKSAPIRKDLRQKFLRLFSAGQERLMDEIYPILFLSELDSSSSADDLKENCEFISELEPNAIFDFDVSSQEKGIYNVTENVKEKVVTILTTDDFDKTSSENKENPERYTKTLDGIRTSAITPWVFCNGYEPLAKIPMTTFKWKKTRREGFKEAIRFYHEEIPEGRAVVLFLLFSKTYDVLLEAAEEVLSKFQNEWIVLAENEEIVSHWKEELLRRESVDKQQLEDNCIIGIPWTHVNKMIKDVVGSNSPCRCEIPTSTGVFCHLKNKTRNELFDLQILNVNECHMSDIVDDRYLLEQHRCKVEEAFFQGGPVDWWNFWFHDQVLKRSQHDEIVDLIEMSAMEGGNDDDTKVPIVNLFHQPGAGGTTTARHILWCLKEKYRCAIIRQISEETCSQIEVLRNYEDPESPKPPIILIDNFDEEKIDTLHARLEDRARVISLGSLNPFQTFCVLFLCTRRVNLSQRVESSSVNLKHELNPDELEWFNRTNERLLKQHDKEKGLNPRLLISFNILKENFDKSYITRAVQEFVSKVESEKEKCLLQHLAVMNSYDIEFQALPVSAFDSFMSEYSDFGLIGKTYQISGSTTRDRGVGPMRKNWESRLSSSMQVLLNRSTRICLGSELISLSIINSLFAKEILNYLLREGCKTVSEMMIEVLKSSIFKAQNRSIEQLKKIVKDVLIKRDVNEQGKKTKFSPLITNIEKNEGPDQAATVLEEGFKMTNEAMIAQQISRLYMHVCNWDRAERFARIATNNKPDNSYLWDTLGQVYKNQLVQKYDYCSKSSESLTDEEAENMIEIALNAMNHFQKGQSASEKERYGTGNDAVYYGEIQTIVSLLDLLSYWPPMKDSLHTFLVNERKEPDNPTNVDTDLLGKLKNFQQRSEIVLRILEEKNAQLKVNWKSHVMGNKYEYNPRQHLTTIRENLDIYFGEDNDHVPDDLNEADKAEFRRRRVKRLGGRSIGNILDLRSKSDADEKLSAMSKLLTENVASHFCNAFDLVSLLNVTLVQGILGRQQHSHQTLLKWSKQLYDKVVNSHGERPFLEAFMYLVMYHWPSDRRIKYHAEMCSAKEVQTAIKRWKDAFHNNHPRQRGGNKIFRKRETTFFFLGKGNGSGDIVHHENLGGKSQGDIWTQPMVKEKLERLTGTLVKEGKEIQVQIETSHGNKMSLFLPNSIPVESRIMYNKRVFFYLGFSWSGPKALKVSQDKDPVLVSRQPRPRHESKGKDKFSLPKDVFNHEEFQRKLMDIDESLKKIGIIKKRKKRTEKENEEIRREGRLIRERADLLRRRKEYMEH